MQDLIGRTLGHYRIVEHLGGGGMGVVYKAEDTKLGRTVALKFLPPEWSRDPDARERFLREARAASALEDSRICTIFDIDETDDGQLFIAMAYYDGETLKKRLKRGRLSIGEAVDIAIQVAEGLESAHSAEILHRDIKPANLMLTGHDEVVIVDFGLAKLAGEHGLTQTGASVGTPHYMSPEQSGGKRLDARTDLWSLGVVLFEMLTGERPFAGGNNTSVARAVLDDKPASLRELRPEADPDLGAIVFKLLSKDADKRYQSASELLSDLRLLKGRLADLEVPTLTAPSINQNRRWLSHSTILIGAILIFGTVSVFWCQESKVGTAAPEVRRSRIVVLPFRNLGKPEDDFFADGITQEITSRLSSVSGLQVISNRSAMYYRDREVSLHKIGKELDVDYVLEGAIRWDRGSQGRGRVRITPQLIDVAEDSNLWSDQYDRVLEDIFEVQAAIAREVVDKLHITLFDDETSLLGVVRTDVPEAYEAYLRGMSLHSGYGRENQLLALEMFEKAVTLDPNFAEAWALLSFRHTMLVYSYFDATDVRKTAAKETAERALELEPNLPLGHMAKGIYFQLVVGDYDKALRHHAQALSIRPSFVEAQVASAAVLRHLGRWVEATEILEEVRNRSPKHYLIPFLLSGCYQYLGDIDNAIGNADLTISLAPDNVDGYQRKFSALIYNGRLREAQAVLDTFPEHSVLKTIRSVDLDIASRRFQSAIETARESDPDVYVRYFGELRGGVLQVVSECTAFYLMGQHEGVQQTCARSLPILEDAVLQYPSRFEYRASLGLAYAILERKDDAIREVGMATTLETDDAFELPLCLHQLALVYAIVGEDELAIDAVRKLLSMPSEHHSGWFRVHPYWDSLRGHPRFLALLEEYETKGQ